MKKRLEKIIRNRINLIDLIIKESNFFQVTKVLIGLIKPPYLVGA